MFSYGQLLVVLLIVYWYYFKLSTCVKIALTNEVRSIQLFLLSAFGL